MHYIESGVGPPLVLLHAFPVDARMWNDTRARLEDQARVITPDQRGMGESPLDGTATSDQQDRDTSGAAVRDPSMEHAAADVLTLLDDLRLSRVVLGGCSMGGYVAMSVLRAAPDRVAGLLLVDTKAEPDGEQQRSNRVRVAERAENDGVAGWLAGDMVPNLLGGTTHEKRTTVVDRTHEIIDSQSGSGIGWAQRAMAARPDNTELLRSRTGPTLVVTGAEDSITPPDQARELAGQIPGGEFTTVRDAGHLAPLENPDGFVEAVGPWLHQITG